MIEKIGTKPKGALLSAKLLDSGRLTLSVAQVEEFRSSDSTLSDYLYALDTVRIEWEYTLHTNIVCPHFSDIECPAGALSSDGDANTFKVLHTLFVSLFDANSDSHRVTRSKFGYLPFLHLCFFEILYIFVFHD